MSHRSSGQHSTTRSTDLISNYEFAWKDGTCARQQAEGGNDADSQLEFWHTLAERRVTSNDEAFHGLLLDLDSKDEAADYGGRVSALKARKLLPADFARPANEGVSRGTLAVALVQVLRLKGGWTMRLFGNTPRYCLRELEFEGLYPPSSENQTFSGAEFLGIVGKMEDFQGQAAPASGR